MNQLDNTLPNHDEIALCAFLIWEKEGRQPGREQTYWLQAEAQLRQTRQQQAELAAAQSARPWPPQATAAPKVATARALKPAAPKPTRLAAAPKPTRFAAVSKTAPAKPAPAKSTPTKSTHRSSASAAPTRRAMARG